MAASSPRKGHSQDDLDHPSFICCSPKSPAYLMMLCTSCCVYLDPLTQQEYFSLQSSKSGVWRFESTIATRNSTVPARWKVLGLVHLVGL